MHVTSFARPMRSILLVYLFIYFFIYIYRTSCRKSLPARILRVIASCVNSNHKQTHHCNVNDIARHDHERSTSTRMETIARGEGLYKAFHEDEENASSDLMSRLQMQSTSWCALAS